MNSIKLNKKFNKTPNPGVIQILRISVIIQTTLALAFLINAIIGGWKNSVELSSLLTVGISLIVVGVLVYHPRAQEWLKNFYLLIVIGFQTLISITIPLLFTAQESIIEFFIGFWLLIPSIFIPLSIVGLQSNIKIMFFYALGTNILDMLILLHVRQMNPEQFLNESYLFNGFRLISNLCLRFTAMVMMGYIVSLLVNSIRKNELELKAANVELAQLNENLEIRVDERTLALEETNQKTLSGWVRLMELRHFEPVGHTQRMIDHGKEFGAKLGLTPQEMKILEHTIVLHDVGKLGIPDQILLKPEPLTDQEWRYIKLHVDYSVEILREIEFLQSCVEIVEAHHERWNGSGYPRGLSGKEIPYLARVFTVIEVYDVLTHGTIYRPAWEQEKARRYLRDNAGILFDPLIIAQYLGLLETWELDQFANHL